VDDPRLVLGHREGSGFEPHHVEACAQGVAQPSGSADDD